MESIPALKINIQNFNNYLYCPSGNCHYIPEINYSLNPLETEFKYKCQCQRNIININDMVIKEFLQRASYLYCYNCKKKIPDNNINYCLDCKIFLDNCCAEYHFRASHNILSNDKIFNFCFEHKNRFMFRCIECNQSLCCNCDLNYHNDRSHTLKQLSKSSFNQKDIDQIKLTFEKQKRFFEKIKIINNKLMQTLENDIIIKEKIITNYLQNQHNYNSYLNMNNLFLHNNEKYETILENILSNNKKANNNTDYINNYLSMLFYSLMINKEDSMSNSLINELSRIINNIITPNANFNSNMNLDNQLFEDKTMFNNNFNSKNNSSFSIHSNKLFNSFSSQNNISFPNEKANSNISNQIFSSGIKENNISLKQYKQKNFRSSSNKSFDSDININKNLIYDNRLHNSIKFSSQINSNKNMDNISYKIIKSSKSSKKIKEKNKSPKEEKNNNINTKIQKNIEESDNNEQQKIQKVTNNNTIYNMTMLKSGNIAISIKEAIEIYNLRKLNFSKSTCHYNNEEIKDNCLLQKINLVKGRYINYVYELFDETLLCATYSKIFRIKLSNHDLNYEVLSFIKIGNEFPRKIISLGKEFLVVLTEYKKYCNIKIFKKTEGDKNDIIIPLENDNNNEKNDENNCNDVPPIGNCGLFINKDINEDTSFELIKKNINENRKLFVSIYPLNKNNNNNNEIEDDNYLYEFIATANAVFDYTTNRAVFYGLKKNEKGEYCVEKIKEIEGLSCSIEVDSICQINDKYICVGLQKRQLNKQISGFAFIDIYKREVCRIINDEEISCLFYNAEKNLLFASMEIQDDKREYFKTKIYEIVNNKGDRGNEDIDLKNVYQYDNKQYDSINSIGQLSVSYLKLDEEKKIAQESIVVVTSSKDSSLEVVKFELNK